ncbi:MAG: hypothetical protein AAGF67_03800 [Verrucomicrobiota bacterium]
MDSRFAATFLLLSALLLSSCSNAKKRKGDLAEIGLLGALKSEPVLTETTVERLQEIADDPSSSLDDDSTDLLDLAFAEEEEATVEAEMEVEEAAPEPEFAEEEPLATPAPLQETDRLVAEWEKDGLNPRSIEVGDIFTDHAGPILKKASSLADHLDLEDWTRTIDAVAEQRGTRVPVTLSVAEINALQDRAPLGTEFPTRSVALDFRTITQQAKKTSLEKLYEGIQDSSEDLKIKDEEALKRLAGELESVKSRLEKGESLFVITGVTQSDEMKATYPGAPLGSRDAELIENAVATLYPHLDNLSAEKTEKSVLITRDPSIYWEFEIRELKLEDGKIVIDEESLAQR